VTYVSGPVRYLTRFLNFYGSGASPGYAYVSFCSLGVEL